MNALRNALFISLLVQVCLAGSIFGAAEGAPIAFVTIPIAILSTVLIDIKGWLNPPRWLLNLAAMGAVGFAIAEFRLDGESRLLAGGHLILYLTWMFLLQRKDLRRLWWMFALSVLQVAMGAVLTVHPWFGAALFIYTISTIWTMSLLSLVRAALLLDPQLLTPDGNPQSDRLEVIPKAWQDEFAMNSVRMDDQGRWFSPRFLAGTLATFVLSLIVGMTFFILTPRVWLGNINTLAESRSGKLRTGFTDSISLGDNAELLETNELVMEYEVIDQSTGQAMNESQAAEVLGVEPLFRGSCLENYDPEIKSWQSYQRVNVRSAFPNTDTPLELRVQLQPLGSTTLFYAGRLRGAYSSATEERLGYHRPSDTLLRSEENYSEFSSFSYHLNVYPVGTLIDESLRQRRRIAFLRDMVNNQWAELLVSPSRRISELSRNLLIRAGINPLQDATRASQLLESYLRDSSEFRYSLILSVDDPQIDPIEDFVFNRKRGHCEYFASALALMLRSVGIPTRLISGFKGSDYNIATGKFEVRSLHAHAWVEAFVDGDWTYLDPTPGDRDEQVAQKTRDRPNPLIDQTRSMWYQGMNYSKLQQDKLVYGPLFDLGGTVRGAFNDLMEGRMPVISAFVGGLGTSEGGFGWKGSVIIAFLTALLLGLVHLIRRGVVTWRERVREWELIQRRAITVEFYSRFIKLVRDHGMLENSLITPREFALQVETKFSPKFSTQGAQGLAQQLTELFYSVRFGDQPLTREQITQVDYDLSQMERSLAPEGAR